MPEIAIKRGNYSVKIQIIAHIVYYLYFIIVIHSADFGAMQFLSLGNTHTQTIRQRWRRNAEVGNVHQCAVGMVGRRILQAEG